MTMVDDPGLAERIRRRERAALEAVVRAYLAQIVRAARGGGLTAQQAEEVAQETFAAFVESAPRFEGRSHVRTWLFGILYRKMAEAGGPWAATDRPTTSTPSWRAGSTRRAAGGSRLGRPTT